MGSNIDALIAGGIRPPQVEDPQMAAMRAMQMRNMAAEQQMLPLKMQTMQLGLQQTQEEMQARQAMNQLLTQKGPQATDDDLLKAGGTYATPVIENRNKMRQSIEALKKSRYDNSVAEADLLGAAGAKLKALGNTQDGYNAVKAELPPDLQPHMDQLLQGVGGDISKVSELAIQGSLKQREAINQRMSAEGTAQRGRAATVQAQIAFDASKQKQFNDAKAAAAVDLSQSANQADYETRLAKYPPIVADQFDKTFDRDKVLDVARTPQQIVAGENKAEPRNRTEGDWIAIMSNPNASDADKAQAKQALALFSKQHAADRPPTVNVSIPGLGGAQTPAQAQLTGEDFLKTLPPPVAAQIRGIAEGRLTMPSASARTGAAQQMRNAVMQYDPEFSEQRAQVRKAFTTGPDGKNIGNLNTSPVHLEQLDQLATALGSTDVQLINRAKQTVATWFGGAAPTSFDAVKNAAVGEVASALKGNATDLEIKHISDTINSAQSPAQLHAFVNQTLGVLHGKLNTYLERYQQQIPNDKTWSPILPSAKAVFDRHGIGAGGNAGGAGEQTFTVTDPRGTTHHFRSAQAAAAFKSAAGIK